MRTFRALSLLIISIAIVLVLNSCERDQYIIEAPITIGNDCDTNNISFLQTIKLTINTNCEYCHNDAYAASGVNLEGYDNIKKSASNGTLKKSINGTMKVYIENDCDYVKIKAWINQGSKNN